MSEDVKYRNDEERERRQRLLRKAIENLGVLRPPGAEGGAAEAGRPAAAEASNAQQFSANLTPSDQELAEKIETKSRLISHEDFFARLGVARTSSKEQIKSWFFQLAKTYHPDRLPPALAHLAPQASKVFEQLREAYDTLVDDARRIAYLSQLNRGAAAPPKTRRTAAQEEAKKELVLAEGAMRKKEFAEAEQHFARAQELEPNALHLASRAWAIYLDPSRKADIEKAKSLLAEALRTDASCDRALYYSGIISRVEGNGDLAERFFRSALSANPKNVEAQAELRLMEMRRQKPDKPKKGFFW
jgi:curved DNA-binding protein CbpA